MLFIHPLTNPDKYGFGHDSLVKIDLLDIDDIFSTDEEWDYYNFNAWCNYENPPAENCNEKHIAIKEITINHN